VRCAFALCPEPATERVMHPMRPESRTLVCERHARRARAVAGDKIKCPPVNVDAGRPHAVLVTVRMAGEKVTPRPASPIQG
jgi:hypothetical protein